MMTEEELATRQRAYDTGLRYGQLDARAGLSEPSCEPLAVVGEGCVDAYERGWREGYKVAMLPLRTPGVRVSVPSLVQGMRVAASVTGRTKVVEGIVRVECMPAGATVPLWLPVAKILVK